MRLHPLEKQGIQIFLSDTTGQLTGVLRLADFAFIGKSMPPNHGGQTPIEAAGWEFRVFLVLICRILPPSPPVSGTRGV